MEQGARKYCAVGYFVNRRAFGTQKLGNGHSMFPGERYIPDVCQAPWPRKTLSVDPAPELGEVDPYLRHKVSEIGL
jgi:hypothetical protein